jgi:hypothetical protein
MKTDLNQCAQCGNHIHKEHEIECKENGEVLCIGCSWLRTNDSEIKVSNYGINSDGKMQKLQK